MSRNLKLFLTLIFGFCLGLTIKRVYEANVFHAWVWPEPPIVINCYGKVLPEIVVVRAIDYWTIRGFPISFYEMNPSKETCANDSIEGFIIIRRDPSLENINVLGQTARHTQLKWMRSAVISLRPGSYNLDLLLEHELGHALGLGHVEVEGHIMHPMYMQIGSKFWIPK
tara:strand:- start:860 stop:1366 length:507 start_codon:yes stop_codon:yes gene_type:complete